MIRIINSFRMAKLSQENVAKVRAMNPKRTEAMRLPYDDEIKEKSRKNEKGGDENEINNMLPITFNSELELNMDMEKKAESIETKEESREDRQWRLHRLARTQVLEEDIVLIGSFVMIFSDVFVDLLAWGDVPTAKSKCGTVFANWSMLVSIVII